MQPATVVLIYVIIWWVILFMALPIGLRGSGIDPKTGAPKIPNLRKKALWVSGIAVVVTAIVVTLVTQFGDQLYIYAQTGNWSG